MDELQIEVPRGDIDRDGHHLFMVASPDGTCYLVNKQSGNIYWSVKTNRLLRIAFQGENVKDYLDLRPQEDYKIRMYHFQPHRSKPQLIPYDTAELLKSHFDQHYGEEGTEVSKMGTYYFIEYGSGVVNGPVDCERGVVESNASWNLFKIKRVEYYLRRSSPMWSLRFLSIKAWFPSSSHEECVRVPCVVYHALDTRKFIKVCKEYNLHPLPSGCPRNELIMNNNALIQEKNDLTLNISKMSEMITNNKRIDLPLRDDLAVKENNETFIFKGKYDGVNAVIKKVRRRTDVGKTVQKLRLSSYHPNICAFLGWESDGEFDYFAFEECGQSLEESIYTIKTHFELTS